MGAKVASEKAEYDKAIAAGSATSSDVSLNMRILVKDGDELIADSDGEGGFLGVSARCWLLGGEAMGDGALYTAVMCKNPPLAYAAGVRDV